MLVLIRMLVYTVASALAGYGFAELQDSNLTINLDQLAVVLSGLVAVVGTWILGRFSKAKGGKT